MSDIINFENAKSCIKGESEDECLDLNDFVLDISDVVFTADDISYNTTVTDDYIIIEANPEKEEQ